MPKVTFNSVVRFEIKGDNGDLVKRFLEWSIKNRICSKYYSSVSGAGQFIGLFTPEDAEQIKAWWDQENRN